MMIGELVVGRMTRSMALTADGWHMGTHVGALGLTLAAYWYARTQAANDAFSFGTGKVYSLAGYTSGVLLALVAVWMAVEGIERLAAHAKMTDSGYDEALVVAALGFVVNLISATLLGHSHSYGSGHHHHGHDHDDHHHDHGDHHLDHDDHHDHDHGDHDHHDHHDDHDHEPAGHAQPSARPQPGTVDFNLRAAYIHILADALTSLGALGALALGKFAGLWYFDPAMGLIGGAVILAWSFSLCRQASRQLLDVVSSPQHEALVRSKLEAIDDVRVADLHVWELGPGRRSCVVSIVTARPRGLDAYRSAVLEALDIAHLTIEVHECGLDHALPLRAS
jgi:cation diffusion facilitator family transporter